MPLNLGTKQNGMVFAILNPDKTLWRLKIMSEQNEQIEVKDIITKLSENIIDKPNELSRYLIVLTANLWKYGKTRIEKDVLQAKKWGEIRLTCDTDGQTDKRIKATEEWKNWQMAIISEKTVLELIRSLKKRLQSLGDELKSY